MPKSSYHGYGKSKRDAAIHLLWTIRGEINSTAKLFEQQINTNS